MKHLAQFIWAVIGLLTAVIGYNIHQSVFFAFIDWLFWPIVWAKWLMFHEINLSIIKGAFAFFMQ